MNQTELGVLVISRFRHASLKRSLFLAISDYLSVKAFLRIFFFHRRYHSSTIVGYRTWGSNMNPLSLTLDTSLTRGGGKSRTRGQQGNWANDASDNDCDVWYCSVQQIIRTRCGRVFSVDSYQRNNNQQKELNWRTKQFFLWNVTLTVCFLNVWIRTIGEGATEQESGVPLPAMVSSIWLIF